MGSSVPRARLRALLACLASVAAGGSLVVLNAPSQAANDYPYAGEGQCPIAPTPTAPTPGPQGHTKPGQTDKPGKGHGNGQVNSHGHANGHDQQPAAPTPTPTPIHDPVSGHDYYPPAAPPTCERHVWAVNGSIGDPWGFALRNCTSFVAWRLRQTNGVTDFANDDRGQHWGDANHWDTAARALGYAVDSVPAIGAVAQTDAGRLGHVAWVESIGPGTVTVEEYNHWIPGGYDVRTVPTSDFTYLHVRDLAPSPYVGSQRPVVSVPTSRGESWTAAVAASGALVVTRPDGHAQVVPGAYSLVAAPSMVLDGQGRPWVASIAGDASVTVATLDHQGGWGTRVLGTGSATSSPALVQLPNGRLSLLWVSSDGDLVERHQVRDHWSAPRRLDRGANAPSFAAHAAPASALDSRGRVWVVAVARSGLPMVTHRVGRGWARARPLPRAGHWSTTSTPSLTLAADGTLWMHAVTNRGRLTTRQLTGTRWGRPHTLSGTWSTYSSPAVTLLAGRLWVAAVDAAGRTRVFPRDVGRARRTPVGWPAAHLRAVPGALTGQPAFLVRSSGRVFVVTGRDRQRPLDGLSAHPAALARALGWVGVTAH